MQVAAEEPELVYLPKAHWVGDCEVEGHVYPAGHVVQAVEPASEYVPAVHATGAAELLAQDEPAGQTVQTLLPVPAVGQPVKVVRHTKHDRVHLYALVA